MADCRYENFDIAVHGQADPYLVRAVYAGREAEGELAIDNRQPGWTERLTRLLTSRRTPGRAALEETGALLFAALWRDQVRDLWLHARSDLESGAIAGLRLRLSLSPPAVAALPWEALYDPDRGVHLSTASQTPLGRVVNLLRYVGAPRPLAAQLPLRVLFALPEDPTGQLDANVEWGRLQTALAPLLGRGVQLLRMDGRFDLLELRRRLEQDQPHVLHLLAHGRPNGVLLWQDGQPQPTQPTALHMALADAHSLRLVLLAACSTAQVFEDSPLSSLGAQLLQTGAPAVIAMQVDVRATSVAAFSEHFYQRLLTGPCPGLVDVAANYARSCLVLSEPDQWTFAAPVLWLNAADGRIFTPDRTLSIPQLSPPFAPTPPRQPERQPERQPDAGETAALLEELAVMEEWLADVPLFAREAVPSDLRSIEAGRRKHIDAVRDQLELLAGESQVEARAARFGRQRAALQEHREHVERLTALLRDHLRPAPGAH